MTDLAAHHRIDNPPPPESVEERIQRSADNRRRDEFAMAALTGLLVGRKADASVLASEAYIVANAMMEARK